MSKKTKLEFRAFTNVVVTTSATSAICDISGTDIFSVQYVWSGGVGTPTGSFTYEVSNDGVNFVSYAHVTALSQSGDSGTAFAMMNNISTTTSAPIAAKYMRVKFTLTGGTSVIMNGFLFGKSLSA